MGDWLLRGFWFWLEIVSDFGNSGIGAEMGLASGGPLLNRSDHGCRKDAWTHFHRIPSWYWNNLELDHIANWQNYPSELRSGPADNLASQEFPREELQQQRWPSLNDDCKTKVE
jgi:hypothetical protein